MKSAHDRVFRSAFVLCCAASVAPLWVVTFPPLVDLPQHAAQVATWLRWDSAEFDYSRFFWSNLASPYVTTNLVAYLLSLVVGIVASFKVLMSAALVGLPLATLALTRESKGNPWWAFLAFPAAYSFPFFMGFTAFCVTLPLTVLALVLAWRYSETPSRHRGWALIVLLQGLFFTHALLFGWAGLVAAGLVAARSGGWRETVRRWLPLLGAALVPALWLFVTRQVDSATQTGTFGGFAVWDRVSEFLPLVIGWPHGRWAALLGGLLLVVPLLTGGRPSQDRARWLPLGATLLIYLLIPFGFFGTGFLHERFVSLVLPTWLFALDWRRAKNPDSVSARRVGLVLVTLALSWSLAMVHLFRGYEAEMGAFPEFLEQIPANAVVLYLPYDNTSQVLPHPVYLHAGHWYQVRRGGLVEFSFSKFFQIRFRYRPDNAPKLPPSIEWRPRDFDWYEHGGDRYDFILVRSGSSPQDSLRRSRVPWVPLARAQGGWWLWGPPSSTRSTVNGR